MTPADYDYLRALLKERSALALSGDKHYLVESRLLPVARKHGWDNLTDLVGALRTRRDEKLIAAVIEAMMTNESFFFRDKTPFEHFRDVMVPALLTARASQRVIRVWCAAASTGQEPYSLAMCLKEMGAQTAGIRFEIVATDIGRDVLERAKAGIYSQFEAQRGLPIAMLLKYFTQSGETWQIAPELRGMVKFQPFNLLDDFASLGHFDIVFCRNVLIYFDQPAKIAVLERFANVIAHDGYLVLGAAETTIGLTNRFMPMPDQRGLYVHRPADPRRARAPVETPRLAVVAGGR